MNSSHRSEYHRAWSQIAVPLRPTPDVVRAVREQIAGMTGRTLLLGVTPELADVAPDLIAVDGNPPMVRNIWPGNSASRHAVVGNWLKPLFARFSFSSCVGDGSLNALRYPMDYILLRDELAQVLDRGAKLVCRVYAMPDAAETTSAVANAAASGTIRGFHAFKMRLAMALAAQGSDPYVSADAVFRVFTDLFSDRNKLVAVTGWDRGHIDTIDFYNGSTSGFSWPTRYQFASIMSESFSNVRFISCGNYELAERCPILVMERD